MENDRKFIDHLLALRDHYQKEIQEYERSLKNARAQLEHINALLLDQLERQHKQSSARGQFETVAPTADNAVTQKVTLTRSPVAPPPDSSVPLSESASTAPTSTPSFSSTTPTPPTVPAATESRQPPVAAHPAQQLAEQLATQELPEPVPTPATQELLELAADSVTDQLSSSAYSERSLPLEDLPAEPESTVQGLELATPVPTEPAPVESAVTELGEESAGDSTDNATGERSPQRSEELANPELAVQAKLPTQEPAPAGTEPVAESVGESTDSVAGERSLPQQLEPPDANSRKFALYVPPFKTLLLPAYQHLKTKSEAIEKFLQDNEGKIFSIEDITRALHGDLEPEVIRAEKPRMYATLNRGVKHGFWQAVPGMKNYYTVDLKSLLPTVKQPDIPPKALSKRTASRRSKYSDVMLPRYRQLKFSEAVGTVIQEKVGQVVTPEQVTRELYGDVSAKDLTIFQDQVGKALWAGARLGRWQRVPRQLGQYTLDLKLVKTESNQAGS